MLFSGEELTLRRILNYLLGLYLITLGIAFSIKSGLGSAPVSSIPYAVNLIWLIDLGLVTFMFHAVLVLIEWILLRSDFNKKHFLQVFVGVVFGIFTSFSVSLMGFIPHAGNILIALLMIALSILLIAVGIFAYVSANLIPLAPEGLTQAIAITANRPFPQIRVYLDVSFVLIALLLSYGFLGTFGSVGIGTVLSALFIGTTVNYVHKAFLLITGDSVDLKKM